MNTALRLVMAALITLAIVACQPKPKPPEPPVSETTPTTEGVSVEGAPDPRDYTDARNFDNPESLLSKRIVYFDFDKSSVRAEYRDIVAAHAAYVAAHSAALHGGGGFVAHCPGIQSSR